MEGVSPVLVLHHVRGSEWTMYECLTASISMSGCRLKFLRISLTSKSFSGSQIALHSALAVSERNVGACGNSTRSSQYLLFLSARTSSLFRSLIACAMMRAVCSPPSSVSTSVQEKRRDSTDVRVYRERFKRQGAVGCRPE
jgi:hypothetical protein